MARAEFRRLHRRCEDAGDSVRRAMRAEFSADAFRHGDANAAFRRQIGGGGLLWIRAKQFRACESRKNLRSKSAVEKIIAWGFLMKFC